jgi:hypothetical protein
MERAPAVASLNRSMDDNELIPLEWLSALPSDPFTYALKQAWHRRLVAKMEASAREVADKLPSEISIWLSAPNSSGRR